MRPRPVPLVPFLVVGLLAAGLPMAGGQDGPAPAPLVVSDPTGDPFFVADPPAPLPVALWPQIDITSLRAGPDSVSHFELALTLAGRDGPETTLSEALAATDIHCEMFWAYNGDDAFSYSVQFFTRDLFEAPGGDPAAVHSALVRTTEGPDGRPDHDFWPDGVVIAWDPDLPGYSMLVKKRYAQVMPDERPPALGDTLTDLRGICRTDAAGATVVDQVPDGGGPASGAYAFLDPGPGNVVRLSFPDEELTLDEPVLPDLGAGVVERVLGVASGETAVLPFRMENLGDRRETVTISTSAYDAAGSALAWNLTVARSVEVKPGEVRTANVIVRPPAGLAVGDTGSVRIDIVTASGDLGRAERAFVVVPIFTPDNNRLRFHSVHTPTTETPADAVVDRVRGAWDVTMSLQDPLPGWDDGPVPVDVTDRNFYFTLPPLARPLLLESDGVMALDLHFGGSGTVLVRFTLVDEEAGTIFHHDGVLQAGGTTKVERLVLTDEPFLVKPGAEITGRLSFVLDPAAGPSVDAVFDPAQSGLTLPVLPDAGVGRVITDGRYVPSVYLEVGEIPQVFVNPKKTYAFALVLANDGAEPDEISLSVQFDTPGWQHRFVPGERFRIEPGNVTPVGLEIVAPELPENTRVPITVLATSKFDPLAVGSVQLVAKVQNGIDVPERRYTERDGALKPYTEPPKAAPGPGVLAFAVLVAALVAAARVRPVGGRRV